MVSSRRLEATVLAEPELQFAHCHTHIDPRAGIRDFGPADLGTPAAPDKLRIGLVGPTAQLPALAAWLNRCRNGIDAKESKYRNLFPPFPGFRRDVGYRTELIIDDGQQRALPQRDYEEASRQPGTTAVHRVVELYLAQIEALTEAAAVDVIVCVKPPVFDYGDDGTDDDGDAGGDDTQEGTESATNFHDVLKARAMRYSVPLQITKEATWTGKTAGVANTLQDEATRAWNFLNALYYKGGGTPWRFVRRTSDLDSLYVGVSFFRTLDNTALHTASAQVFNERGDGVIVRGGKAQKHGKQPYLSHESAHQLLDQALNRYSDEHHHQPARVVIHKTSAYHADERAGFERAANDHRLHRLDLVWVFERPTVQLFRTGELPVLRGTSLRLDEDELLLYTRGTTTTYGTYAGMYVPNPLSIRPATEGAYLEGLASEILALSKMNWNNTQYDGRTPISIRTARSVGRILRQLPDDGPQQGRYAYYM